MTPTVLIVDDHQLFRAGVRAELEPLLEIAGEAGSVAEAVEAIEAHSPDVVLLDVHMPDGGGVEVIRRVAALGASAPCFLALSVSDAAEDVIAVIRAGARGYMYKEIALRLDISPKTVEAHVSSVLRKLQLSSRHELTRWAAERGLDL